MTTPQQPPWLLRALKEVGYHEGPGNDNKYGRALGLNKVPWCDLFVTRMCQLSGHPLPSMQPGMKTGAASVWYSMQFAKAHGLWVPSWKAKPGFQIVYGWQGPSSPPAEMHTGLVISSGPTGDTGHTVEANRGDAVGRFTFTVGSSVVLGCIDLPKLLLGRERIKITPPKPDPQPRNPHHPSHTGPSPKHITPAEAQQTLHRLEHLPPQMAEHTTRALSRVGISTTPQPRKPVKEPTVNVKRYSKTIVALIGAVGTWATVALADGVVSGQEWTALGVAVLAALGVYTVPNQQKKS